MSLKTKIKACLPASILNIIYLFRKSNSNFSKYITYNYVIPYKHQRSLQKLKKKNPIRCVFLALDENIWKYDGLYRLMQKDTNFEPIILVCPIVNYGYDNMIYKMNNCYNYYKNKGYHVILSYNKTSDIYVDLRKDLNPDIIFYTNNILFCLYYFYLDYLFKISFVSSTGSTILSPL